MTLKLTMPETVTELKPRITVIGVGGAGGNAVNNMIKASLEGVEFVVTNTDAQALSQSLSERKIQLGVSVTQGLGAGSRPDIGRAAAEESIDEILEHLYGAHMAFITAGMGGGTGTGAAPVIARAAREQGLLTVGVITKPFHFEGTRRMRVAESGIEELQQFVDTLIIIPNQNLFRVANEKTTFADAFKMADDVLYSGVRGVTDLMVMPGLINLDFADIRAVMTEMGKAQMGTGEADGDKRSIRAAEAAISNPLLDDVSMKGARGVLINITGGPDMTLFEVDEAANRIREEVDAEANIIFGSTCDESLEGRIRVSVVATGIEAAAAQAPRPSTVTLLHEHRRTFERAMPSLTAAQAHAFGAPTATARAVEPEPAELLLAEEAVETGETPPTAPVAGHAAAGAPAAQAGATGAAPAAAPAQAASAQATGAPRAPERTRPFIAPRPSEPARAAEQARAPEPFAAAALANGGRTAERPVASRGPSLFERVIGTGRARKAEAPRAAAEPAQAKLSGLERPEPAAAASAEDDLLDIPAFLRRQAN
jgi:cell division protein FtsZ